MESLESISNAKHAATRKRTSRRGDFTSLLASVFMIQLEDYPMKKNKEIYSHSLQLHSIQYVPMMENDQGNG